VIDQTRGRAYFYRIVISPERAIGETADLKKVTRQTMRELQKILRSKRIVPFVAVAHTDHSQTPHVHALAVLRTYLTEEKLAKLREACEGVVLTGQEVRQNLKAPAYQARNGAAKARSTRLFRARSLGWQPRSMPVSQDIFIAKEATRARGGGGLPAANNPARKLFICPGCNQSSKLKKTDNYFECKRCGMEIGRKKNLHIFAQRREGGQSYT
jgi:predicted RNA-binding Zn-ribbon protein involved in translation (DUF1610 family)